MAEPAFASVAVFDMDLTKESDQRDGLNAVIVPGVRAAPGVVSACWTLDRPRSESTVVVTFDSLGAAERFADGVKSNASGQAAVGIKLLSIRVAEVLASF